MAGNDQADQQAATGMAGNEGRPTPGNAPDRRGDQEASGDALRRQMASPVIESVTTMVCVMCGAEQFFDNGAPAGLKCQRCGSMVFRTFDTPTRRDEATIAHLEEEARSISYGDSSPQTAPEDVRDLDMK